MPFPIKAKLGDLITIRDFKTDAVTTIEIDSTRKSSVGLVIKTPQHIAIGLTKCKHRDNPAFQHGVPLIGVDMADPSSASITTHAVLPAPPAIADRAESKPRHSDPLAEKIKDLLVAAGRRDAKAMDALMRIRIECNEDLADHPTIVVGEDDGKFSVGIVGLLNGLLHSDNRVAIVRDDESGNVTGFCVVDATPESESPRDE